MIKYLACISFIMTCKCVPLSTFLCITFKILSISACFGKHFCTRLPVLIKPSNSQGSWKKDLSGLWYASEIMPSWNRGFSSKSILISGLIFVLSKLCELPGVAVPVGLDGGLYIGSGYKGMSLIIGLLWVTSSLELVIDCAGAVECVWFVILNSVFFWCLRNFLWQFWCLSNSLINGWGLSFPHSCSLLSYQWSFLWDFITF